MKSLLPLLMSTLLCTYLSSQTNYQILNKKQIFTANQEWIQVPESIKLSPKTFFEVYKTELGLPDHSEMKLTRTDNEKDNWNHYRYQQYFSGVKILGSEYILHEHSDNIKSANGRMESVIDVNTIPSITSQDAITIALSNEHSQHYAWESNPGQYPKTELVIMDSKYPDRSGELVLAYKMDIYSSNPFRETRYYINAHSGEVILSHNLMMSCFKAPAVAQTLYEGPQNIETELKDTVYTLHDVTRGGGITTQSAAVAATQYTDADNNWESGSVTQRIGALDAHFGAQSTYDYYKNAFNRNGIDAKGGRILCKMLDTAVNYVNAFWDSPTKTTNFGLGDNKDTGPLTSLDVVGHEMTHGVTEYNCSLEYLYDAGALNEAISDIFGKTIEYKNDSTHFSWLVGTKFFFKKDSAFRDMTNPNYYKNPKNYKGKYWVTPGVGNDNGGVHTNSGVLNYWFYILVTGQSGTNEFGKTFQLNAMGFDAMANIVYQMSKNFLTSTSNYFDTREASLHVAENLYGKCSAEYKNIAEAWKAVNMGSGVSEGDLLLVNNKIPLLACKEGLYEVAVKLVNQSCDQIIPKGSQITLSISVKQKNKIVEIDTLENDLLPGESVNYKFKESAKIDKTATQVTVEALYTNDADTSNNRFVITITKNNNSEYDFRVLQVNVNGSPCEGLNQQATIQATYNGCDPVPAGTELDLNLNIDNQIINKKLKTITTIYPAANYRSTSFTVDRIFTGYKKVLAELKYANDTTPNNNTAYFNVVYVADAQIGYLEPFEQNKFDSALLAVRIDSFQNVAIQSNLSPTSAMVFSGGNIFDNNNRFIPVSGATPASFMSGNSKFTSTMYTCIDTKNISEAYVSFDYIQKLGSTVYDSFLVNPAFAAMTRVQFRNDKGTAIGAPVFIQNAAQLAALNYFEQAIPITGGPVSIEITNITLEGSPDNSGIGIDATKDYILIDNLNIHAVPVATKNLHVNHVYVYPNPITNIVKVNFEGQQKAVAYSIYNILGKEILKDGVNSYELEINTESLQKGHYILKTYFKDGSSKAIPLIKINK